MPMIFAAVVALACQEADLKPLCEVAKRLDEGMKLFLAGKDMKESFKDWDSGETSDEAVKKLREDLVKDHVTSANTFAIDLRLQFFSEGKMVYEVQSLVYPTATDARLLAFRGRASQSSGKPGVVPEKLAKDAKPFGDAGMALLNLLKTKKAADLPFANEEKTAALVPAFCREEMRKATEESKTGADALRKELNELKYDQVKVALNELMFTTQGPEGAPREGMVRGKLKFNEEGEARFRLSRYETK
jgi:hypothetical protein